MPKSWWGKTIMCVYIVGYFGRLTLLGIITWPHFTFCEWHNFMARQAAVYEPFWLPGCVSSC